METITRKFGGVEKEYEILTQAEADERGLSYRHWREASGGEKALTDDGFVVDLVVLHEYTDKRNQKRRLYTFSFCRRWEGKRPLNWADWRGKAPWATKPMTWIEDELRRRRGKAIVRVYAQQLLAGNVDYHTLGQVFRPDHNMPWLTAKQFLSHDEVQEAVNVELRKILSKNGIDEDYVIRVLKDAIALAVNTGDPGAMIRAAKEFSLMLGMNAPPQDNLLGFDPTLEAKLLEGEAAFQKHQPVEKQDEDISKLVEYEVED